MGEEQTLLTEAAAERRQATRDHEEKRKRQKQAQRDAERRQEMQDAAVRRRAEDFESNREKYEMEELRLEREDEKANKGQKRAFFKAHRRIRGSKWKNGLVGNFVETIAHGVGLVVDGFSENIHCGNFCFAT